MTTLVTGGGGYIGSHMVWALYRLNEPVVVLDDLSEGTTETLPVDVPVVIGDIGDAPLINAIMRRHRITAIAHFAAKIVVPASVEDPLTYYSNNTCKSRALIETAISHGIRHFIFSSTAAVYGETGDEPVTEQHPTAPISPYGRSKLIVEWMLRDAARAHRFRYVALRYFNVAGADPNGCAGQTGRNATHLIKLAVQAALGLRETLEVFGVDYPTRDGSCLRDYIHVSDLARAHVDALYYLRHGGEPIVCNVGYARGYSVLEIIRVVKRFSQVDFKVVHSQRRPGDPAAIVACNDLIRNRIHWTPVHDDIEKIIQSAFEWERRLAKRS